MIGCHGPVRNRSSLTPWLRKIQSPAEFGAIDIAAAIEAIAEIDAVVIDSPAVGAGVAALRAGGDFAGGVTAGQGERFGGTVFASFERGAGARLRSHRANAAGPPELTA